MADKTVVEAFRSLNKVIQEQTARKLELKIRKCIARNTDTFGLSEDQSKYTLDIINLCVEDFIKEI